MYRVATTFISSEFETNFESDPYTLKECAQLQRRHMDALKSRGCEVIVEATKMTAFWPNGDLTIVECVRA